MAGGIDWFRWHHGSVTDPKFQLVARRSGASLPDVLAVWAYLLEKASASETRGSFGDIDAEALDCLFGFPATETRTADILNAMRDRKLIAGDRVSSWEKRQPKRERESDETATERKREQRAREAAAKAAGAAPPVTKDSSVTPCHATSHHFTPRGEESREEKKEEKGAPTLPAAPPAEDEARATQFQEPTGTPAGAVCRAMRQAGLASTNPGDPRLLALLAQGATDAEFVGLAAEAAGKGKGWAWVLSVLQSRRAEAAAISLAPRPEDAPTPWHETASGIKAKGADLGMRWSDDGWVNGECIAFPTYKARVLRAAGVTEDASA